MFDYLHLCLFLTVHIYRNLNRNGKLVSYGSFGKVRFKDAKRYLKRDVNDCYSKR